MAHLWWLSRFHTPVYTGNEALIATLHEMLEDANIVAMSGLGGMGKSELALAYIAAYEAQRYTAVVWLNASSAQRLNEDFLLMSQSEPRLFNSMWLDNERTVLVLDTLDDVNRVQHIVPLSRWKGHLLLTTRFQQTTFPSLRMPLLSQEESAVFVLRRAKIIAARGSLAEASAVDRHAATEIAQELDGFPLALEQAGTYLEEVGCSPARYLSLYRGQRSKMLGIRRLAASSRPESSLVEIVEETVRHLTPESQRAEGALATLPPDAMERRKLDPPVLNELLHVFLVQPCADPMTLCMHRLVRTIIRGEDG